MFEYMTVQEAAKLWEIAERRIQKLCEEKRIDGVVRLSRQQTTRTLQSIDYYLICQFLSKKCAKTAEFLTFLRK